MPSSSRKRFQPLLGLQQQDGCLATSPADLEALLMQEWEPIFAPPDYAPDYIQDKFQREWRHWLNTAEQGPVPLPTGEALQRVLMTM